MKRSKKYSSNQEYDSGQLSSLNRLNEGKTDTYREDETSGYYPISNNEKNNGNCWIGRPLFVNGENVTARYYIKELSRSEGYELSVTGKNGTITNGAATGEELKIWDVQWSGRIRFVYHLGGTGSFYIVIVEKIAYTTNKEVTWYGVLKGKSVYS